MQKTKWKHIKWSKSEKFYSYIIGDKFVEKNLMKSIPSQSEDWKEDKRVVRNMHENREESEKKKRMRIEC